MIPRVESQRSTQISDVSISAERDADLLVNNLVYEQPKPLSVAVNRTVRKEFSQRNTYTGGSQTTMVWDWNTGTSYVDPRCSFLKVTVTVNGDNASFGTGSAMNMINEVRIRSRSGTEIDRVEQANVFSRIHSLYSESDDYLNTQGSAQGFGRDRDTATDPMILFDGSAKTFCIPLKCLSGFFRPLHEGMLIPPQLASGLRVELSLEQLATAFFKDPLGGGTLTSYEITDPVFHLATTELTDDMQRTINEMSAKSGLEYTYERVFTATNNIQNGQRTVNQQIHKAVANTSCVFSLILNQADKVNEDRDSLAQVSVLPFLKWQYRLGSLYFPWQAVEDGRSPVSYMHAMDVWDKLKHGVDKPTSVTFDQFLGIGKGVVGAVFEKNSDLQLSGLPVNNSRSIELDADIAEAQQTQELVSFMTYASVAKCYTDNVAVAI